MHGGFRDLGIFGVRVSGFISPKFHHHKLKHAPAKLHALARNICSPGSNEPMIAENNSLIGVMFFHNTLHEVQEFGA